MTPGFLDGLGARFGLPPTPFDWRLGSQDASAVAPRSPDI